MDREEKLSREIADFRLQIARGNVLITRLRAVRLHRVIKHIPIGKLDEQLRAFHEEQQLRLANLERLCAERVMAQREAGEMARMVKRSAGKAKRPEWG